MQIEQSNTTQRKTTILYIHPKYKEQYPSFFNSAKKETTLQGENQHDASFETDISVENIITDKKETCQYDQNTCLQSENQDEVFGDLFKDSQENISNQERSTFESDNRFPSRESFESITNQDMEEEVEALKEPTVDEEPELKKHFSFGQADAEEKALIAKQYKGTSQKYAKSRNYMYITSILRAFRKEIKHKYEAVFGTYSNRRWSDEKRRQNIKDFFTKKGEISKIKYGYNFQEAFYDQYEIIFSALIYQKNANDDHWDKEGKMDSETLRFARVTMKDMFGPHANRSNLIKFFNQNAIQALWWPCENTEIVKQEQLHVFYYSVTLDNFMKSQSLEVRENIVEHFASFSDYDFFPTDF